MIFPLAAAVAGLCVGLGWLALARGHLGLFLLVQWLGAAVWCLGIRLETLGEAEHSRRGWLGLNAWFGLAMPGVGLPICMLLWLAPQTLDMDDDPADDLQEKERPRPRSRDAQTREALMLPTSLDSAGTAVAALRSVLEQSGGARQLQNFLHNPRADVYHLAQAELGRLSSAYGTRIAALRERLALHPDETDTQVELAEELRDYALSGLLSDTLSEHYCRLALERWVELQKTDPGDPRWALERIDLLLAFNRAGEALAETEWAGEQYATLPDLEIRKLQLRYQAALTLSQGVWPSYLQSVSKLYGLDMSNLTGPLRSAADFWLKREAQ